MNKAHTATVNRIARRYKIRPTEDHEVDFHTQGMTIEVETTATLRDGIKRLKRFRGAVYLAVTNMEAVKEALRLTKDTHIGVMDPRGNIVKESSAD